MKCQNCGYESAGYLGKCPECLSWASFVEEITESENLADDLELVAVIAAAIAASQGAVSTDGFVVRSIRKVRR